MVNRNIYFPLVNDADCRDLNGKLVDVIKKLQDILNKVPQEHQHLVNIDFTSDYDGGMEFDIGYYRLKTEEEIAEEEARALKLQQQRVEQLAEKAKNDAAAEKRLYRRLKKKYEN